MKPKMDRTTNSVLAAAIIAMVLAASASAQSSSKAVGAAADVDDARTIAIARRGSQPAQTMPSDHFTGTVRVDPLFQPVAPSRAWGAAVTFEPGARTAWHTHPLGQVLIVTSGVGRVQQWGGPVDEIRTGDVVWIPPGVKHWHGASPSESMTHIGIVEMLDGKSADWLESVTDAQYAAPLRAQSSATPAGPKLRPSRAAIGDFAPKLAELTDDVLYGDVWERPQLTKHDRSLVTVAALIAMNRPDQLRSHFLRARENGVTKDELIETITHLAFYAGWPSAVTAVGVAREVFDEK